MAINLEAYSECREENREPFEREASELVNFDSYLPYFVDPIHTVPVRPSTGDNSRFRFVHQHAYFTEPLYRQLDKPEQDRDRRLVALRNSPYSQIIMRSHEEVRMHIDMERFVEPPPETTIDDALRDYFDIDLVGSTLECIQRLRDPIPSDQSKRYFTPPPEIEALSTDDKVDIFLEVHQIALNSLASPRVLSHRLVTSALKRMAVHLEDQKLSTIADERLADDETYYPIAMPWRGHLRVVGGAVLRDAVGLRPLEEGRLMAQALQTEVNGLQLAA